MEEWYLQVDMQSNEQEFNVYMQVTQESGKSTQTTMLQIGDKKEEHDIRKFYIDRKDVQELKRQSKSKSERGKLCRNVFITARESYKTNMDATGIHSLPCGRFCRDEFHQEPSITNQAMTIIRDLILRRAAIDSHTTPKIMMMSGTPIRLGARDLVGVSSLWSLAVYIHENGSGPKGLTAKQLGDTKNIWESLSKKIKNGFWRSCTPSGLIDLSNRWKKDEENCVKQWKTLLLSMMIRRKRGSRWVDGNLLLKLPRMHWRLVPCPLEPRVQEVIRRIIGNQYTTQLRKGTNTKARRNVSDILAKCATVPGLAILCQKGATGKIEEREEDEEFGPTNFDFGVKFLHKYKSCSTNRDNETFSLYDRYMNLLTRDNPKFAATEAILMEQLPRKDFLDRPAKGIIFFKNNEPALLLHKVCIPFEEPKHGQY